MQFSEQSNHTGGESGQHLLSEQTLVYTVALMAQTDDTLLKVEHLVDVVIGKPLAHFGISAKGKTLSLQKS